MRALREDVGLTQAAAAERHPRRISTQAWQKAEAGEISFKPQQILELAQALGRGPKDLERERDRLSTLSPDYGLEGVQDEGSPFALPVFGRTELADGDWRIVGAGQADGALDLRDLFRPTVGVTYLADDRMSPRGGIGEPVIFDRAMRPKPGKGCVVETADGRLLPRIFLRLDPRAVVVGTGSSEAEERIALSEVKGVYAVRFWAD